jgi:hypothetical protein
MLTRSLTLCKGWPNARGRDGGHGSELDTIPSGESPPSEPLKASRSMASAKEAPAGIFSLTIHLTDEGEKQKARGKPINASSKWNFYDRGDSRV